MGIRASCRKFYYYSLRSLQLLYYPPYLRITFSVWKKINWLDTTDMYTKTYYVKRCNQMLQTERWVLNNRNNGVLCLTNKNKSYLLMPLVYWLWLYFPFYFFVFIFIFWKNNSLLVGLDKCIQPQGPQKSKTQL